MEAQYFPLQQGTGAAPAFMVGNESSVGVVSGPTDTGGGTLVVYGVSITDADLIMSDGKSLENAGVTPDQVMLPTAADMEDRRDPVLAYAAEKAGVNLDPKAAGALFPFEWKPIGQN